MTVLIILLVLAVVIGVPWLISVLTEGASQAVGSSLERSRTKRTEGQREIACSLGPEDVIAALELELPRRAWTVGYRSAAALAATSRSGCDVQIVATVRSGKTRLAIRAVPDVVESAAGEILSAVRVIDPGARVRPVRS